MSKNLREDVQSRLDAISDTLANASTCFDVWREMQDGRKRELYEPVVAEYPIFFETTIVAHLVAMSTLLYSVLETRRNTHNIPGLIRAMSGVNLTGNALLSLEEDVASLRPIWAKVARIRNEAFGHRSNSRSPLQVFSEIQLHPDEVGQLVRQLKELVRRLAESADTAVPDALNISASRDTQCLMLQLGAKNTIQPHD